MCPVKLQKPPFTARCLWIVANGDNIHSVSYLRKSLLQHA